jgi:signal transduction histidine kinase
LTSKSSTSADTPRPLDTIERPTPPDPHERRLELVSGAVSGLTHDLNNTLSSIANYAELCAITETPASKREEFGGRVVRLVEEGAKKIQLLKSVASARSLPPAPAGLDDLLALVLAASETALRRAGLAIELHGAGTAVGTVEVSHDDAVHALLGLVDAARAAAQGAGVPRGSKLVLSIERADHRSSVVLQLPQGASFPPSTSSRELSTLDALAANAGARFEGPDASGRALRLVFTAAAVDE